MTESDPKPAREDNIRQLARNFKIPYAEAERLYDRLHEAGWTDD